MTDIMIVLNWKFPGLEGIDVNDGVITAYPGGIPSQEDQDTWTEEYNSYIVLENCKSNIKTAMYDRIYQGIKWALNPGSTAYDMPLTDSIQYFLSRNLMELNEGRLSPHTGFIFNGTEDFNIDDAGLRELVIFSGSWGNEISRIRLTEISSLSGMTYQQLLDYDANAIDWSIDWSLDPQNNGKGWDNDRVNQNP